MVTASAPVPAISGVPVESGGRAPGGRVPRRLITTATPAQATSPTVRTTLEASATASADPRGMTGERTAISATSRGPIPPGNGMSRKPTAQASA